jgi:hypothetical protein
MIAFVQPEAMGGSGTQRGGSRDSTMLLLDIEQTGIGHDTLGIGLTFEITKRLYGKENAIYPQ